MDTASSQFDVIVIGGGHAGIEAAIASSKLGQKTLLVTMNVDNIGLMSCNPAVGGLAKSHLVKEIDALGGVMALLTDETAINIAFCATKGMAVRATRCQVDRIGYREAAKRVVLNQEGLFVKQAMVTDLLIEDRYVRGIITKLGQTFESSKVIIAPGTFTDGKIHVGLTNFQGGRFGEGAAYGISDRLRALGFAVGRLKTGTVPRLDARTIDFSSLENRMEIPDVDPLAILTSVLRTIRWPAI